MTGEEGREMHDAEMRSPANSPFDDVPDFLKPVRSVNDLVKRLQQGALWAADRSHCGVMRAMDQGAARIMALEAELATERENNAAEFADRTEAQRKNRALEAEVARLTESLRIENADNVHKLAIIDDQTDALARLTAQLAEERAGADALAEDLTVWVGSSDGDYPLGTVALTAHEARRKGEG